MRKDKNRAFETICVHGSYQAESGQAQVQPIIQSTTFRYYTTKEMADIFDLDHGGYFYSRLGNPTVSHLEEKMALLEGGTAAVASSSGQAATMVAVLNLCGAGDHILSAANVYGGTHNLFGVSLEKLGVELTLIDQGSSLEEIIAAAKPGTKLLFGETLGNPALSVLDFKKFSKAAKAIGVPLIVDNTLATPALCRPLEHGADLVVHSLTKYADGHGSCVGGIIVEGGSFDWNGSGKFPGMTEPDASYHGLRFYDKFGDSAFSVKARGQLIRDFGCTMSPMNAYLISQGLQTLPLRMERHSANALALAGFLQKHAKVDWVRYPGLPGDPYYELAQTYMPKGASGVLCFGLKGGREAGESLLEKLRLTSLVIHVGDIRTCALHPASTTHRQLTNEEQKKAGIRPELVRISVGIEHIDDIIADFDQALRPI